ncbi:hypothetical protein EIB18_15795 [Caulobacter vibrioides]|nr:hypothetical protein EIB18_15795 [Caulobacter vibrioides]
MRAASSASGAGPGGWSRAIFRAVIDRRVEQNGGFSKRRWVAASPLHRRSPVPLPRWGRRGAWRL